MVENRKKSVIEQLPVDTLDAEISVLRTKSDYTCNA